jgi:hypothetical protein
MVKDIPPPPRLSTRTVLIVGICCDALVPFLYYLFDEMSFGGRSDAFGFRLLVLALMLSILFGIVGTFVGSVMWARRAANEAVIMAEMGVIFFVLIYGNLVKIGFDDPKIMVIPFAVLVAILLFIGRVIGHVASNGQ